jgi:PAS domain S-box-containing protein
MRTAPPDLARSALDAAPDAMIIIDAGGIICFTNRQVSALFGYEHDDIVGQSIEMLMPRRFRARHVGHRENYVKRVRGTPHGERAWSYLDGGATALSFRSKSV